MALLARVIPVEIFLELIPDGLHESEFLLTDSVLLCCVLAGAEIEAVAEIFLDEFCILEEGDESVGVIIKFLENSLKVYSTWLDSDEERLLSEEADEISKTDLDLRPLEIGTAPALEDNLHEVDG